MHSAIFIWIGLILLDSMAIIECRREYKEESDEMVLGERDFDPVARREHRYDYETLAKRLNFERRSLDKKPCGQIVKNQAILKNTDFPQIHCSTVEECMKYCDSLDNCVAWDYYTDDQNQLGGAKACSAYGPSKPPSTNRNSVLSGYCDSTQRLGINSILGVGKDDGKLYTCFALNSNWNATANNDIRLVAATQLRDGTILGVDSDGNLQARATLDSRWAGISNSTVKVKKVTQLRDGTIVGIGMNGKLYTRDMLYSDWTVAVDDANWNAAVTELKDGTILIVATNGKLYTRPRLNSMWADISNQGGWVSGITQLRDGTILGVGGGGTLYTFTTYSSSWIQVSSNNVPMTDVSVLYVQ